MISAGFIIHIQFGKYFHVSTGVNNLLDTTYYEHLSRVVKGAEKRPLFAPGRNIYVALAITF